MHKNAATYESFPPESVGARRILHYVSKIGKKEILDCLRGVNIIAADFNPDKVTRIARRKAKDIGRPLKMGELLAAITSIY
jgi:isopropylmalate/homocitrate/citramalate synthase